jgi:hypothetical protein
MWTYIITEEARCQLSHYIEADSKEEALDKLYSWDVDSTELDEILDTIEVFKDEIVLSANE